jgi:hypothetical protein
MAIMRFYDDYDVMVLLGCEGTDGQGSSIECVEAAAKGVCTSSWTAVKNEFPDVPEPVLQFLCFSSAFLSQVFVDGFGVTKNHPIFVDSPRDDWSFGGMYYEVTRLPINPRDGVNRDQLPSYLYALVGTGALALLVSVYMLCKYCRLHRVMDRHDEEKLLEDQGDSNSLLVAEGDEEEEPVGM